MSSGLEGGGGKGSKCPLNWAYLVAQTVKNLSAMWENWVRDLGWEDPLEQGMATHFSILAWRVPKDRGAWHAAVHRMAESDMTVTKQAHTHPLNETWGFPVTLSVHILVVQRCHLEVKRMKKIYFPILSLKKYL